MKRAIVFALSSLIFTSLSFAEPKGYTNEDLDKYESQSTTSETPLPSEQLQQESSREERYRVSPERPKSISRTEEREVKYKIGSSDCEVISFNATVSGIVTAPSYTEYGSVTMRQCVRANIRNLYGMTKWVKDFSIVALFVNNTTEERRMIPLKGHDTTQILSGETYTGAACFGETALIVKLGCNVSK